MFGACWGARHGPGPGTAKRWVARRPPTAPGTGSALVAGRARAPRRRAAAGGGRQPGGLVEVAGGAGDVGTGGDHETAHADLVVVGPAGQDVAVLQAVGEDALQRLNGETQSKGAGVDTLGLVEALAQPDDLQ